MRSSSKTAQREWRQSPNQSMKPTAGKIRKLKLESRKLKNDLAFSGGSPTLSRKGWQARNMKLCVFFLITSLLATNALGGSDGFSGIKCGSDIPKALIGKRMSNETVVVLEKRHADLGLKDLGADEISNRLNCVSWSICGSEYMTLEDESIVRDVLKVPPHSKTSPLFLGTCEMNGKEGKDIVVAILDNEKETDASALPAKVAWKIDQKNMKFVSVPIEGLRCPRTGVITSDGGL
jgi:hypothetical protein